MNCEIITKIGVDVTKADWSAYKKVQNSGAYNMYDPNARASAGVSKEKWMAMMQHYSELQELYGNCVPPMVEEDCSGCGGAGVWQYYLEEGDDTEYDCEECDGTGVEMVEAEPEDCDYCCGTGCDDDGVSDCPDCDGWGVIEESE